MINGRRDELDGSVRTPGNRQPAPNKRSNKRGRRITLAFPPMKCPQTGCGKPMVYQPRRQAWYCPICKI